MPVTSRPTDADLAALRASIERELPAFLADLEHLVNIDCGSYVPAGVDEVGRWTGGFLERLGARVEYRPDPDGRLGSTVLGTFEGRPGGARVLLIGHMDTVFEPGTPTARPFRLDGNIATGPGVTDMKAGLLAGLYALRAIGEAAVRTPDVRRQSGRGSRVADVDPPHPGGRPRTPTSRLVLECGRANGDIVSSRKGIADQRIVVHGRAAHAGIEPEKGRHAILEAARIVREAQALNGRWPGVTFNVGTIQGGTRPECHPRPLRARR